MKNSKTIFTLGLSILVLAGCSHPNAMPSGYTHHHDVYKSPSPDSATKASPVSHTTQASLSYADVDRAVDDLLRKITARAGVSPKPVYILTPTKTGAFYNAVDSALRSNMRDLGYAISDIEIGAYGFAYSARQLRKPRGTENDGFPNTELALQVYDSVGPNARLLTEQSGNYFIAGADSYNFAPTTSNINTRPAAQAVVQPQPSTFDRPALRPAPAQPPRMEMIEQQPITPDIDYKSLSGNEGDGTIIFKDGFSSGAQSEPITQENYGQRPKIGKTPTMASGHLSKKVEY